MALNDNAVLTAAKGYIFTAPEGSTSPTPAEIENFNSTTLGCEVQEVAVTATGGTFTLALDAQVTGAIAYDASADVVRAALEALANIGVGNVQVSGGPLPGAPVSVTFVGKLAGQSQSELVGDAAALTGTSPSVTVTETKAATGWVTIGHTSREELPEFGYDGGDTETRGTWQAEALRTVSTEALVDYVIFRLHQIDNEGLKLYYGTDYDAASQAGEFRVSNSGNATRRALLMVIVDGDVTVGFYAPKTDIRREDAVSMAVDGFTAFPLRSTFLSYTDSASGTTELFRWISEDTALGPVAA
jgi:hypothetical protein